MTAKAPEAPALPVTVGECESCQRVRALHIEIVGGEVFAVCDTCPPT